MLHAIVDALQRVLHRTEFTSLRGQLLAQLLSLAHLALKVANLALSRIIFLRKLFTVLADVICGCLLHIELVGQLHTSHGQAMIDDVERAPKLVLLALEHSILFVCTLHLLLQLLRLRLEQLQVCVARLKAADNEVVEFSDFFHVLHRWSLPTLQPLYQVVDECNIPRIG